VSCLLAPFLAAVLGLGPAASCGYGASPHTVVAGVPPGSTTDDATTEGAKVRHDDRQQLAGKVVVLDAGHQLGNHNFPEEINRPVPAGGFTKPCNTTGTATNAGYPEATFAWRVTQRLKVKLEKAGATVVLTRTSNREDRWGPCVDERGRAGNKRHADLKISLHGDGSTASGAHGFHVIYPPDRAPWTDDIHLSSLRLAKVAKNALVRGDFTVATYIAGGDGLDERADLATLNLSDVPTVMLELGNMRDRGDAAVMTSPRGQARYAAALASAARIYLGRPAP
jgi:N-acetylmuramoyl-L-alanine amidase